MNSAKYLPRYKKQLRYSNARPGDPCVLPAYLTVVSQCLVLRLPAERCEINGNAYLQLLVCAEVPMTGGSTAKAHQLWEWSTEVGWMGVRQRTLPWWDRCLKPTHKTTSLSEEGQAMTICQRTTLSHLAGLALPRARISQALITYSSTVCAFSRLRLTSRQTKVYVSWRWQRHPTGCSILSAYPGLVVLLERD